MKLLFKPIFIASFYTISSLFLSSCFDEKIGNEYVYTGVKLDNSFITRHGLIIVEPTIVDYSIQGIHIIGIRLPAKNVICGGRDNTTIMVSPNVNYFILNTQTHVFDNYLSKDRFTKQLENMNLKAERLLDFSRLSEVQEIYEKNYKSSYYNSCIEIESVKH